jgi:hypothetical protein
MSDTETASDSVNKRPSGPTLDLTSAGIDYDPDTDTFLFPGDGTGFGASFGSQVGSDIEEEEEEDDEDEDSGMPEGEDEDGNDPDIPSFKNT